MSGHPLSIAHNRKTGVLSEKALQGTSTYRATRWQAKALQTHRPAMREDGAELPFLCRACVRPYTAQIRPHCLVFRFRSSHHVAAPSSANFGIKGTLAISILSSAAYGFEVPTRDCRELIGTSNPPHWFAVRPI